MSEVVYLTPEGLETLRNELQELKTKGRKEIARQIQEAREKGDLSENAEYAAAKEAQGLLEIRIANLERTLANARVIDPSTIDTSKVSLHCTVALQDIKSGRTLAYTLVSETEADVKNGKISLQSPIGRGLLGKKVGETAEIQVPSGVMKFKILSISARTN